jgi:hypothetical protein
VKLTMEVFEQFGTPDGIVQVLFASTRKHHPDLSIEEVRRLFEADPDRAAAYSGEMLAGFRRAGTAMAERSSTDKLSSTPSAP